MRFAVGRRVGRELGKPIELLLRACGVALAQQIALAGGNHLRIIGIDKFQPVERLAHQILTSGGFPEPNLLQQLLLLGCRGRIRLWHQRDAQR